MPVCVRFCAQHETVVLNPHETKPEYHLLQERTGASARRRSSLCAAFARLRCLLRAVSWLERDRLTYSEKACSADGSTRTRPSQWSKPSAAVVRSSARTFTCVASECRIVCCMVYAARMPSGLTPCHERTPAR